MKRFFALLLFCLIPLCGFAEDGVYALTDLITPNEGEEIYLALDASYYSGAPVYKGNTDTELSGACVLHSTAVVVSNLFDEMITAQQMAKANNKGYNATRDWTASVVWGRIARAFSIDFDRENLADYRLKLINRGTTRAERSALLLERVRQNLETHGDFIGLIAHFNSSGKSNGGGKMHAVVIVGYIKKDDEIVDLIVNDCNVPAPQGACVRMSESSLPLSMIGEKRLPGMTQQEIVISLMETLVSCRWVTR